MTDLKEYFQEQGLTELDASNICSRFRLRFYKKGTFILEMAEICRYLGYIKSGVVQYYYNYNKDGKEITSYISGKRGFAVSFASFLDPKPSRECIRAVVQTELWCLNRRDFEELKKIPSFRDFYMNILESQLICIDNSRFDLLTLTASERYLKMLHKEPELLQQIPLKYLAQMLGVAPRHLSSIRNQPLLGSFLQLLGLS